MNINSQNEKGQTRLMLESYNGNYKMVRKLMICRADINIIDQKT